jgi:hypothetical protein
MSCTPDNEARKWALWQLDLPPVRDRWRWGSRVDGAKLGTLRDDSYFPSRGAIDRIDSPGACSVVGTGEVTALNNTPKQRLADISPNCASKAKSMTSSEKIATKSPRCRIESRSTPQGDNVPKTAAAAASQVQNAGYHHRGRVKCYHELIVGPYRCHRFWL